MGPASSFILCVQKKLGYWRFRRFEVDAGRRGDTRRRVYRPEPDPRALSGESGERQSLQPSSRRWLNVIYIDVNAVEDFRLSEEAQAWWQMPATQQKLRQARDAQWVDYATVTALKITALRMAWTRFAARDDAQMAEFRHFIAREGESLYWQAAFDALHAYQVKEDEQRWGWPAGRRLTSR